MRYHNITKCDMKNGDGLRVVLWVNYCEHRCLNCHNPQTWNENNGIEFDGAAKIELYEELEKDYISGLTLSGGDPMAYRNREEILELIKDIKIKFPKKTIWCYTGYLWEDIINTEHVNYIDVIVDGKYIDCLNTPSPKWRGSRNQRVIDVKQTLKQGNIVLWEE